MHVTLYVRVWIEISRILARNSSCSVTLYVRVWIEIIPCITLPVIRIVTLYVRVWIEILAFTALLLHKACHPLREGVD